MFAPDMGPFFVRTTRGLGREHPQLRRRRGHAGRRTCGRLREFADERGVGVHLDGARIWNAHVATGTPLAAYGALRRRRWRCACRKGLGAPVGSLVVGHRRRDRRGPGLAQAARRRHAPGRRARRGRAARPRPPRRAAGRRPRARPAARRGVRRRPGRRATPTSSWSTYPTRRRWSRRPREQGVLVVRGRPARAADGHPPRRDPRRRRRRPAAGARGRSLADEHRGATRPADETQDELDDLLDVALRTGAGAARRRGRVLPVRGRRSTSRATPTCVQPELAGPQGRRRRRRGPRALLAGAARPRPATLRAAAVVTNVGGRRRRRDRGRPRAPATGVAIEVFLPYVTQGKVNGKKPAQKHRFGDLAGRRGHAAASGPDGPGRRRPAGVPRPACSRRPGRRPAAAGAPPAASARRSAPTSACGPSQSAVLRVAGARRR